MENRKPGFQESMISERQSKRPVRSPEWFSGSFVNRLKNFFHPVLIKALSLSRSFSLQVYGAVPSELCIFTASHQSMYDIPTAAEAIKRHVFVLLSDEDKKTISGVPFRMNGVIWICRKDKLDRKLSYQEMVACLQAGKSILMFPEATWNLTPDLLMLPLNWGAVRLSKQTGVPICPCFMLFSDKTCFVQFGKPFYPQSDDAAETMELRDRMATLCWELMERQLQKKRTDLPDDSQKRLLLKNCGWYPRARKDPQGFAEYESQFVFRSKGIAEHGDVFSHLKTVSVNNATAFLFNKNLKG